jgi:predicted phage terminase large subunit-like protein
MQHYEKLQTLPDPSKARIELSKRYLIDFAKSVQPNFHSTWFHENYYSVLEAFAKKKIKRLIVTIPPQHGKSWGSSKFMPAFILGHYPDSNIALMSYSTVFARKFNRQLQRLIDSEEYGEIFPNTKLNDYQVTTISRGYLRNADEFEIIQHDGNFKSIGREGALTGNPVDVMIFDDLYKDAMEGNSPTIRENVIEMYKSVAETRLHNNSQELCVFTRWHEEDLIGWFENNFDVITINALSDIELIENWSNLWIKINYEAIKESEPTELDPRNIGEALYPERHSLEKLQYTQKRDPLMFGCMYQGSPQPKEGLLYSEFSTYERLPENPIKKANYTDTADMGNDYLASGCYNKYLGDQYIYITDILYTQEPMEKTEVLLPLMFERNDTRISNIESNNGGRGFARVVNQNTKTNVMWFHQNQNKESRILTNAATVNKMIKFPVDWKTRWPDFYRHITTYKKLFKANKYDDAPDMLTGIIEKETISFKPKRVKVRN